jgi:hypothetical protein
MIQKRDYPGTPVKIKHKRKANKEIAGFFDTRHD